MEKRLSPPTVSLLCLELDEVVEWELLGIHLQFEYKIIKKIRADYIHDDVDRCKLELYYHWFERNIDTTWKSVTDALERLKYNALAYSLREKYVSILHETAPGVTPTRPTTLPPSQVAVDDKVLMVRKNVLKKFSNVQVKYSRLVKEIKLSLRKECPALELYDFLLNLKLVGVLPEGQEPQFDNMFSKISEQCDFLRFSLLGTVIETVPIIREVKKRLKGMFKRYEKFLDQFMMSTEMQSLVTRIYDHRYIRGMVSAEMKIEPFLGHMCINSFVELTQVVFQNKYELPFKMTVNKGCLHVHWLVPMSAKDDIISNSLKAKQFMEAVGIIFLHVADTVVFQKKEPGVRIDNIDITLSLAMKKKSFEAFEFLLYAFHDQISESSLLKEVQQVKQESTSLLQIACAHGHLKVVMTLIKLGLYAIQNQLEVTPLMTACDNGHLPIVKLLLEKSSTDEINKQGPYGETALHIACQKHQTQIAKCLLKYEQLGINIADNNNITPLMITVGSGQRRLTRQLLLSRADPNCTKKDGDTALHIASSMGHCNIAKELLRFKANPQMSKIDGWTPLMVAIAGNRIEMVELLLEAGADPNTQNEEDGDSAVQIASWNNCVDIVRILLFKGANPNAAKIDGWTPLIAASLQGHYEIVEDLLQNDAEINVQASDGVTPLYVASQEGHSNVVSLLISRNADIHLSKKENETGISTSPLMIACQNGHVDVVRLLLQANAIPNEQNESGATPLFIASYHGHATTVSLLLEMGADPFIRDSKGQNALDVTKNDVCRQLLYDVGLRVTSKSTEPIQKERRALQNAKHLTTRLVGLFRRGLKQMREAILS